MWYFMLVITVLLIVPILLMNWFPTMVHFLCENCAEELQVSFILSGKNDLSKTLGSSPIPLQDFPHLLRKLISPLVKANRCTMVGNLPILQTLFIRAQGVFGFPVSYLLQFDEQNDKRVQFFCSTEVSFLKLQDHN